MPMLETDQAASTEIWSSFSHSTCRMSEVWREAKPALLKVSTSAATRVLDVPSSSPK